MQSMLSSKLRLKGNQVCAVSNAHIKVYPSTGKGSIHDNLLKLKQDLALVVVKVRKVLVDDFSLVIESLRV